MKCLNCSSEDIIDAKIFTSTIEEDESGYQFTDKHPLEVEYEISTYYNARLVISNIERECNAKVCQVCGFVMLFSQV